MLLSHAVRCDRSYLYAHANDQLTELAWIHYGRYLNERLKGKPTQYITHRQEFYGRDFYVNENVLIPRPETEHLVEAALSYLAARSGVQILDVGTGSGAIAITVAKETSQPVLASDISTRALQVAERNRRAHDASVYFFAGDLLQAVRPKSVDLLLSNPPYVPGSDAANMQKEVRDWEPDIALFAGDSGFEIYRRLIAEAEIAVRPGGRLLMELGYRSLEGVRDMLSGNCNSGQRGDPPVRETFSRETAPRQRFSKWTEIEVISDLAGFPRVVGATLAT